MDGLDVRILRAMGIRPYRPSPCPPDILGTGRIAKAVGVTDDTVRARLSRMEEQGVIAAYQAVPNLSHLDLSASAFLYLVDRARDKDEVVAQVHEVDGLLEIHDFIGPGLCLDIAFRDDEDRGGKVRALAELTGDAEPRPFYHRQTPDVDRTLSPLDWRILRALRWDARRSTSEVADEVGVTPRTVRRRRARMLDEGSLFLAPVFDPSRADGMILFDLLVGLEEDAGPGMRRALLETFAENCVHALKPASRSLAGINLVLCANSSGEVEALRQRALSVAGVRRATVALFRGVHDTSGWLDLEIDRRASASSGTETGQPVRNAESPSAAP